MLGGSIFSVQFPLLNTVTWKSEEGMPLIRGVSKINFGPTAMTCSLSEFPEQLPNSTEIIQEIIVLF